MYLPLLASSLSDALNSKLLIEHQVPLSHALTLPLKITHFLLVLPTLWLGFRLLCLCCCHFLASSSPRGRLTNIIATKNQWHHCFDKWVSSWPCEARAIKVGRILQDRGVGVIAVEFMHRSSSASEEPSTITADNGALSLEF